MIRSGQERAARKRYREMAVVLNEQSRRRFVALEARALGRGGVSLMARISGLARSTIYHGLSDIGRDVSAPPGRIRKTGGGRKKKTVEDPTLVTDLESKLADELKLPVTVCHLPPGTSKWNKIEHRLFSFITINWRGKPLRSYRTIV